MEEDVTIHSAFFSKFSKLLSGIKPVEPYRLGFKKGEWLVSNHSPSEEEGSTTTTASITTSLLNSPSLIGLRRRTNVQNNHTQNCNQHILINSKDS